jgi:hypothetical protein
MYGRGGIDGGHIYCTCSMKEGTKLISWISEGYKNDTMVGMSFQQVREGEKPR